MESKPEFNSVFMHFYSDADKKNQISKFIVFCVYLTLCFFLIIVTVKMKKNSPYSLDSTNMTESNQIGGGINIER